MKRPGFERTKRRAHIRLSLEHLEHRRLMAGLNVLVFNDQDGSRSMSPSLDAPAANRLVYVDLNRDLQFQDGEPLAVSGVDGVARFPGLPAGDYLVGLAAGNAAQVITTSVVPDRSARTLAIAPGTPLTSLISSPDLKHAWAATANGVLTPIGSEDAGRAVVNLNGRLLAMTSAQENVAWALVDQSLAGQSNVTQPTLYRLDFQTGAVRLANVQGVVNGQRMIGLLRAGNAVYAQLTSGDLNYVAPVETSASGVNVGQPVNVPNGTLVGSPIAHRFAILGSPSQASGEDQQQGSLVSVVQVRGAIASIESTLLDSTVSTLTYSADGRYMFAAMQSGGVRVFTTEGGLQSAAELAEAAGPITAGNDGRFITANATNPAELIVWDIRTWSPTGRLQLPASRGPLVSLAVDSFGDRLVAATASAALGARLNNPAPQTVRVVDGPGVTQATLGVRLVGRAPTLPERIEVTQSTDEDVPLSFELSTSDAVRSLGSGLFFAPGTGTSLGTLLVTPSGRVSYRAQANANGADSASIRVFDGISTTTLVISLDVRPVNDPPSSFTFEPMPIDESAAAGNVAGLATVFDVDADAQYEITTNDARFIVVDGQVVLAQSDSLDYETESLIELEITATDLDNPAFVITRRVSIPVRDTNDGPKAVSLDAASIPENEEQVVVGRVEVDDPDGHGQYSYSVSDGRFEISDGTLRLRSGVVLDYETESMIGLSITVSDSTAVGPSKSATSQVTLNVTDGNDAPTDLSVAGNEIKSGEAGAVVGPISVIDQDAADEFHFRVSDTRFVVDGNVLRLREGQSISRDQEPTVNMMVTVTDRGGAVLSETVTINVINESPFQNPRDPFDVDNDGNVFPRDALILVNQLNQRGSHILSPLTASGEDGSEIYFLDVNGDGILSPIDALILINHLNQRSRPAINNNGNPNPDPNAQSRVEEDADPEPDPTTSQVAEGEGPGFDLSDSDLAGIPLVASSAGSACAPWMASSAEEEQARRDAIDAELELLVDELSRARLS